MLAGVAQQHPDLAFDFAIAHMEKVNTLVDAMSRSRYFPSLAAGSADQAMIEKLTTYGSAHLAPEARSEVATAIAGITFRIKLRAERLQAIDVWLTQHQ
jgi:aminopeptidase N